MNIIRRLVVGALVLGALVAVSVAVVPRVTSHSQDPTVILGSGTSLTSAPVCSTGTFCISGNGVSGIYPGVSNKTTTVTIVNPNAFTITVTSLTATVGTTTNRSVSSCPTSDVTVTSFSGSFIVAANTTTSHTLPVTLATTTANACQGAVWPLTYYGSANPTGLSCINNTTNGGYTVKSGQVVCITGRVNGGVTVQLGGALFLSGATINGGLTSTGANALQSCGSTINGNVTISGTTGYVLLGDDGDDSSPSCAGNTISGSNVTISSNTGGFEFSANHVIGIVTFSSNTVTGPTAEDAVPEIEANTISGTLSCSATTTPGMIDDSRPNTVIGVRSGQCSKVTF